MDMTIRAMTPAERNYCYAQSQQISMQTGLIGHLRADMDSNGKGFFSTFFDFRADLKTEDFKAEIDEVINALRFDENYGGALKDRSALAAYCRRTPESSFGGEGREFGFRADTEQYRMATCASTDMQTLAYEIKISIKNRLQERVKRRKEEPIPEYAKRYSKSKEIRFIGKTILLPIGYIQHHPPIHKKKAINKYTVEGRTEIHKDLESVDMTILHILMRNPIEGASIEYNDNRLSLYAAQHGTCAITKQTLSVEEIHCHHKTPKSQGGGDEYANLIILHKNVHKLVHATQRDTISAILQNVQLKPAELKKLNNLRKLAGNEAITLEQMNIPVAD